MTDEQDVAESVDEEMVGSDPATADEQGSFGDAPDRLVGVPYADADVTDESLAERAARETPEMGDDLTVSRRAGDPDVVVDSDLVERIDEDGDVAEPD